MYVHSRLAVRVLFFLLVALTFGGRVCAAFDDAPAKTTQAPVAAITDVVELRMDGEVEPLIAEYIVNGIAQANAQNAGMILITVNTPGGLDTSMRANHSGDPRVARAGGCVCFADGFARGFGGIFHFDVCGCGGDVSGHGDWRGVAAPGIRWLRR